MLDAWSAAERREGDRENRTTSITFANELSLMPVCEALLYELSWEQQVLVRAEPKPLVAHANDCQIEDPWKRAAAFPLSRSD